MKQNLARKLVLCIIRYSKSSHFTTLQSLAYLCLRLKKIPISYLEFEITSSGVFSKYIDRAIKEVLPCIKVNKIKKSCFQIDQIEIKNIDLFNNLCDQNNTQYSSFKEIARIVGIRVDVLKITTIVRYIVILDWVCLKNRCLEIDKLTKKSILDKEKIRLYTQILGVYTTDSLFNICFSRLKNLNLKYIT